MTTPPSPNAKNANIHGLRGLAALMVFFFHVYDMSAQSGVIAEAPLWGQVLLYALSGGVALFFMISGYLIIGSLLRHANIRSFLLDRAMRLYPVFLALHIPLFIVAPYLGYKWMIGISPLGWGMHFIANALFLPGILDIPLLQQNAWTLSYEVAFYLLAALIYGMAARHWPLQRLLSGLLIGAALLFYPAAGFLLAGVATFYWLHRTKRATFIVPSWMGAIALGVVLLWYGFVSVIDPTGNGPLMPPTPTHSLLLCLVPGVLFFMNITQGGSWFDRLLRHRFMQFMGNISYSFYLLHPLVMFPLRLLMVKVLVGKLGLSAWGAVTLFGVTALIGTLVAATVSYILLEQRLARWLKHWVCRPQQQVSP